MKIKKIFLFVKIISLVFIVFVVLVFVSVRGNLEKCLDGVEGNGNGILGFNLGNNFGGFNGGNNGLSGVSSLLFGKKRVSF